MIEIYIITTRYKKSIYVEKYKIYHAYFTTNLGLVTMVTT